MTLKSLNVINIGAIRYATYDFLLIFHYVSPLYRFRDTVIYLTKFKGVNHVT